MHLVSWRIWCRVTLNDGAAKRASLSKQYTEMRFQYSLDSLRFKNNIPLVSQAIDDAQMGQVNSIVTDCEIKSEPKFPGVSYSSKEANLALIQYNPAFNDLLSLLYPLPWQCFITV